MGLVKAAILPISFVLTWLPREICGRLEKTTCDPGFGLLHGDSRRERGVAASLVPPGTSTPCHATKDTPACSGDSPAQSRLWQATKRLQMCPARVQAAAAVGSLAAAQDYSTQAALDALPLAERWIVSRLHQVRFGKKQAVTMLALACGCFAHNVDPSPSMESSSCSMALSGLDELLRQVEN